MSELLQRLGVIVIEDAALFDGFPVLVWLMAAELKGFKLRREHAAWVLGAVRAAAACPHRDIRHAAQGFELSQVAKKLPLPPKPAGAGARGGGAGQESAIDCQGYGGQLPERHPWSRTRPPLTMRSSTPLSHAQRSAPG